MGEIGGEAVRGGAAGGEVGEESKEVEEVVGLPHHQIQPWEGVVAALATRRWVCDRFPCIHCRQNRGLAGEIAGSVASVDLKFGWEDLLRPWIPIFGFGG